MHIYVKRRLSAFVNLCRKADIFDLRIRQDLAPRCSGLSLPYQALRDVVALPVAVVNLDDLVTSSSSPTWII